MSVSPLLESKTSDRNQRIRGKVPFFCCLCLTIAVTDHFSGNFLGAGITEKNYPFPHFEAPLKA